ncbi:hypothetical protein EK904_002170, partial [Melospiza melodia maxima]
MSWPFPRVAQGLGAKVIFEKNNKRIRNHLHFTPARVQRGRTGNACRFFSFSFFPSFFPPSHFPSFLPYMTSHSSVKIRHECLGADANDPACVCLQSSSRLSIAWNVPLTIGMEKVAWQTLKSSGMSESLTNNIFLIANTAGVHKSCINDGQMSYSCSSCLAQCGFSAAPCWAFCFSGSDADEQLRCLMSCSSTAIPGFAHFLLVCFCLQLFSGSQWRMELRWYRAGKSL